MAFLLQALRPRGADLQKLVLLDYALVYSADLAGPDSLHTPVPQRTGEVFSRRDRIEEGLYMMSLKGVITAEYDVNGIVYLAGPRCRQLVQAFTSEYAHELESRAHWVAEIFGNVSSDELTEHFDKEGRRWSAEIADLQN